jgi:hypothetical protein
VPQLRRLIAGFSPPTPRFETESGHVEFVVDRVFSEYFGFPCQFSFHRLLHTHHHLSSGAGTTGQTVADVPSGLSLTSPQETEKKYYSPLNNSTKPSGSSLSVLPSARKSSRNNTNDNWYGRTATEPHGLHSDVRIIRYCLLPPPHPSLRDVRHFHAFCYFKHIAFN